MPAFASPLPGYTAIEGCDAASRSQADDAVVDVFCWTLDERTEGQLGSWEWVEVVQSDELSGRESFDESGAPPVSPPRAPPPRVDSLPPTVSTPLPPAGAAPPIRPTPRISTNVTSPRRRQRSARSSPSSSGLDEPNALFHPTPSFHPSPSLPSSTSLSSLSPTTSNVSTASSISLSLTIATRVDATGHRVLTSRRRQSTQPATPSPRKCHRNKAAFGVGEESDDEGPGEITLLEKADVDDTLHGCNLPAVEPLGAALGLFNLGMRMLDPTLNDVDQSTAPLFLPPRSPRLHPIQPFSAITPAPVEFTPLGLPPSPTTPCRRPTLEHQPIKVFTPPPPLYPPSPTKTSTFGLPTLTRSNTVHSTSSSSSSPSKRRHSLQPRKTLRRLSFSRASVSYGPPMSATTAISSSLITFDAVAMSRRASMPPLALTPLERNASRSSATGGGLGVPPLPGAGSSSSEFADSSASGCTGLSTSDQPLLPSQYDTEAAAPEQPRRASLVSFELPPSPTRTRTLSEDAHAYELAPSSAAVTTSHPPLSPSSSFVRAQAQAQGVFAQAAAGTGGRRHQRSASEGGMVLGLHDVGAAPGWTGAPLPPTRKEWMAMEDRLECEMERGKLVVVNPDSPFATETDSPPTTRPSAFSPPSPARPPRPPRSLARLGAPSVVPAHIAPQQIGIAC
ncbi:hypothetical protein Rhopal_006715-T1 [Rhodotorula paludigena]|uniref:Proteophosphoglycan ppg4 n=1 Tax=Rhodotorula paludigena TaxID=86838 RepID=A0AAV5GTV1_9BASI|nr:hypothetical protein Rhopal_006715-T1 [Rhodotorula paludigena]